MRGVIVPASVISGDRPLYKNTLCAFGAIPILILGVMLAAGCSGKTGTYDEMDNSGEMGKIVREEYAAFFKAVQRLGESGASGIEDSTLIKLAAKATDQVVADVRAFPATLQSRLALDALSYAACDLSRSPGFSRIDISVFWEMALLNPIIVKGREYIHSGRKNSSTHIQLVRALQRGMDTRASTQMLLDVLPIVGPVPSPDIMEIAASDSLVLKRVYDLILYSRSLQNIPPPIWMLTGAWFLAIDTQGFFPSFYTLVPVVADREAYLTIRMYEPGAVYESVFRDFVPGDSSLYDAWVNRAKTAMNTLTVDDAFVDGVRSSGLPTDDAHYFFNDYFVHTDSDSVKKEFYIILKRPKVVEDNIRFTGVDSITVVFAQPQISRRPAGKFIPLSAKRFEGKSMVDGRIVPDRYGAGKAWLMPIGAHSDSIITRLEKESLPKFSVSGS